MDYKDMYAALGDAWLKLKSSYDNELDAAENDGNTFDVRNIRGVLASLGIARGPMFREPEIDYLAASDRCEKEFYLRGDTVAFAETLPREYDGFKSEYKSAGRALSVYADAMFTLRAEFDKRYAQYGGSDRERAYINSRLIALAELADRWRAAALDAGITWALQTYRSDRLYHAMFAAVEREAGKWKAIAAELEPRRSDCISDWCEAKIRGDAVCGYAESILRNNRRFGRSGSRYMMQHFNELLNQSDNTGRFEAAWRKCADEYERAELGLYTAAMLGLREAADDKEHKREHANDRERSELDFCLDAYYSLMESFRAVRADMGGDTLDL